MKIIAIVGGQASQRALTHRIHALDVLAHIAVIERKGRRRKRDFRTIFRRIGSATIGRKLSNAWKKMLHHYVALYPDWPDVPQSRHLSANAKQLLAEVERENPDLIVISGTNLLKSETIERFSCPIVNLHTGISPFVKGGPNCTNWALALNRFDLIGNTIMWIDAGIDTGAIIATERTPLTGNETLAELHISVMEHAHDLYVRAIRAIAGGDPVQSVPQDTIGKGRLFYTRQWTPTQMTKAIYNHTFNFKKPWKNEPLRLVSLTNKRASPSPRP